MIDLGKYFLVFVFYSNSNNILFSNMNNYGNNYGQPNGYYQ